MLPDWWPFALLTICSLTGAALLLHEFHKAHKAEWSPERECTRSLRLIQGDGPEVRTFRRGA